MNYQTFTPLILLVICAVVSAFYGLFSLLEYFFVGIKLFGHVSKENSNVADDFSKNKTFFFIPIRSAYEDMDFLKTYSKKYPGDDFFNLTLQKYLKAKNKLYFSLASFCIFFFLVVLYGVVTDH